MEILTIAVGVCLGLVAFALLPVLIRAAAWLLFGALVIALIIALVTWLGAPAPIMIAGLAGLVLYAENSPRCERNRRMNTLSAEISIPTRAYRVQGNSRVRLPGRGSGGPAISCLAGHRVGWVVPT
jgi:hypothetical protein